MTTSPSATSTRSKPMTSTLLRWRSAMQLAILVITWSGIVEWSAVRVGDGIAPGLAAAVVGAVSLRRRSARHGLIRSFTQDVSDVVVSMSFAAVAAVVVGSFFAAPVGPATIAAAWTISSGTLLVTRSIMTRSAGREASRRRVAIIGTGRDAAELVSLVAEHPEGPFELAGVVGHLPTAEQSGIADRWIGPSDDLASLARQHRIQSAMITTTGFRSDQFRRVLRDAEDAGIDVMLSSGVARIGAHRVQFDSLVHEPMVGIDWARSSRVQVVAGRVVDIVGASMALLLTGPVLLAASWAVKLSDRGPIFYRSVRIGRDGQTFGMLKFRSMRPDADRLKHELASQNERSGPLFKISNDPRITPVGRFLRETSIDELPQLINVLRGDMSLVGPRPALPEEAEAFDEELRRRFSVRPGITGLWQVEARSNAAFGAYRRLDLHYVDNWSLALDLQILAATVVQVVTSLVLLPLSIVRRTPSSDGVAPMADLSSEGNASVIDLRSRVDRGPSPPSPTSAAAAGR